MKKFLKPIALLGLALTIIPPIFLFAGIANSLDTTKNVMFAGMLIWFAAAIPWLAFVKPTSSDSGRDQTR